MVFENELMRMKHIGPRSAATGLKSAEPWLEIFAPSVVIQLRALHIRLTYTSGRVEEIVRKAGDVWFQPEDPFYAEGLARPDGPPREALRIGLKTREVKP